MLKKFSKKSEHGKPENQVPDNKDENMDAVNEEMTDVGPEIKEMVSEQTEATSEQDEIAPEQTEDVPEIIDSPEETDEASESDDITDVRSEELNEEFVAMQKELSEMHDKYLRLAAEFDNYRKRTLREKAELIQTAGESLLIDILPVVDDFERGIEQASQAEDMDAVKVGMDLIYSKLKEFLINRGVRDINAIHEPFDTDWHEAVCNIPAPSDDMKGKIVDVIQKGYTLHDKVIRYPKVVVGE